MSQKGDRHATGKAPRTQIEDLPAASKELSEEEASEATGGLVIADGPHATVLIGMLLPAVEGPAGHTQVENTCTAGNALTGADRDYGTD
jgi:hypothetical protein